MSFFKKIFSKKEEPIETYQDFWNWFLIHEKKFYEVVNSGDTTRLTSEFFDVIGPKLDQIKKGIFYLSGMLDDNTADLILTPDGNVSNFYLIEELIAESPTLSNWKFQAFKPSFDFGNEGIEMHNYKFNKNNLHFYPNEDTAYPDDISITFVHDDLEEENKSEVINGCYIFLDNYLGELKFATLIDNIEFKSRAEAEKELISLEKLDSYITWREKEFVEKYEGLRRDTEKDSYSSFETTLQNGSPFMAIMNTELLQWDAKASHPWILRLKFPYEGAENNGFPNSETYELLNKVEDELMEHLKDFDGYLNIGRETGDNLREVYFACKDYRKPCKTIDNLIKKYRGLLEFEYNIYKDKYWKYFDYYMKQA